jgi:hypothetical protein
MTKQRYTPSELDARLKFLLGSILGFILFFTAMGILYALIFVTQPVTGQSENDKMFFNVLGSIATFITGTLAGILIGSKGGGEAVPVSNEFTPLTPSSDSFEKYDGEMPEELPVDEEWDKD